MLPHRNVGSGNVAARISAARNQKSQAAGMSAYLGWKRGSSGPTRAQISAHAASGSDLRKMT